MTSAPASKTHEIEIRHAHFFCGLGGGARGFNRGQARVGNTEAKFRCIGGIDVDPASIRDFERLAGVPGTLMDLFSLEQYIAFHGKGPPAGWMEATPDDVRRAFGYEFPNIVFLSAPCKGFSGLLAEKQSKTDKYQALNGLTLRGMMLMCEAFKDDPPELIIFENVPRIATRGRYLVDQIMGLLRGYGYAVAETTHNCGEIGGLAQSRERFLMVARHQAKVKPFLYEPPKRALRGVGEVLDRMPLPGDARGGPMHRVPALQWKTWVRLAFVEAGKDWRSLNSLNVEDGFLTDFAIAPEEAWHNGALGVQRWDEAAGTVTANGRPASGRFTVADPRSEMWGSGQAGVSKWDEPGPTVTGARSPLQNRGSVADPRVDGHEKSVQLGVRPWNKPAGVVTGKMFAGGGPNSVADPRMGERTPFNHVFRIVAAADTSPAVHGGGGYVADPRGDENRHVNGKYRITSYDEPANAVIAASTTGNGAFALADPRTGDRRTGAFGVLPFDEPTGTVQGESLPSNGNFAVADPRYGQSRDGTLGVLGFDEPAGAITAQAEATTGRFAVADPRPAGEASEQHGKYRVTAFDEPSRAVISGRDNGASAVADPRPTHGPNAHTNKHKVIPHDEPTPTVTGSDRVGSGALSVADPRMGQSDYVKTKYQVTPYDSASRAVIGASTAGDGAYAVADPRPLGLQGEDRAGKPVDHYGVLAYDQTAGAVTGSSHPWDNGRFSVADPRPAGLIGKDQNTYANQAHYGVVDYKGRVGSVTAFGQADNGRWSVADPRNTHGDEAPPLHQGRRVDLLPGLAEQLVCVIIARDGTWHRPFTTLELAALQSLYDVEDALELDGRSDAGWRERIGNAVPSDAATAIACVMGETILRARLGQSWTLSNDTLWVRNLQIALAVDTSGQVPA